MNQPERVEFAPLTLYQVPKVCKCGRKWVGNSFKPAPTDGSRVPHPCDDCIDAEEARKREAQKPEQDAVEFTPAAPRQVFGYDD